MSKRDYRLERLEKRVVLLEGKLLEEQARSSASRKRGVGGFYYSAEEIAYLIRVDPDRLRELAREHKIPCAIREDGEPFFKKYQAEQWAMTHLFDLSFGVDHLVDLQRKLPEEIKGLGGLREFRRIPCVYFLVREGRVVYVGKSVNLGSRLSDHRTKLKYDSVYYLAVPEPEMDRFEQEYIRKFNPEYNTRIPPSIT